MLNVNRFNTKNNVFQEKTKQNKNLEMSTKIPRGRNSGLNLNVPSELCLVEM